MASIFLSHSHVDKPFARKLAADLRAAGHSVWIDEAEIRIGDSLIEKIREGIDQVDYVAAILSSTSIDSVWVKKELDIASNRELGEKRAVVLPLLIETVDLPGFLKGKLYGDFTQPSKYGKSLQQLLRSLGPSTPFLASSEVELTRLRQELEEARATIAAHQTEREIHQHVALRGKSEKLVAAIEKANREFPQHAPINITHAFEVASMPVTLDYLLWAIAKSERKGGHALEILLSLYDQWKDANAMISAYSEMLETFSHDG